MIAHNIEEAGPLYISLETRLVSPGDTFAVEGVIELEGVELGGRQFTFENGLAYDIALTHAGEGILAAGTVAAHVHAECDRCLGPTEFDLSAEVTCYYVHELPSEDEIDDDEDFGLIDEVNGRIDLSEAVMSAVFMELPYIVLCSEDCKGLCPTCGCNLNTETCSCGTSVSDKPTHLNAFSVLNANDYRK